ncbi:unnamed protein product [Paramecium octaurelia]|uniref:Uncharacterized protein n=1 Tax=Paramecium octaurelia TaxID=43137 RepID=A0A8S1XUM2_PAROT|nr:unnamed protein product [Paramecium octaurelia]
MSCKKDNRMDKLQMRLKELEEENRVLKQEQNQLISTLLKQLSELQEQNKEILQNNKNHGTILHELNKICGTNQTNIDLLFLDLNHKIQDYKQQLALLERTCKQYEEIVVHQNKLKERTLKSVSSQNIVYYSKKQSMESLDCHIKLESQLLDEEQSLLELLEIPQANKLCLKIDQLGQQIIEKLRDYSQKRDSRHKLVEQLIPLKQALLL